MQPRVVAQVLAPAQLAVEQRLVPEVAHLRRQLPALAGQVRAEHPRAAAVRPQEAGEHAQQRRLARAVAAEHRERLPLLHAHAHAGERDPLAVPPLEAFELDRSHGAEAYASAMARMVGINHVALTVGDVDEAVEFYGRIFELELRGRVPGMAFLDMGDQFLALAHSKPGTPDRDRHFGLVVDDRGTGAPGAPRGGRRGRAGTRTALQRPVGKPRGGGPVLRDPVHEGAPVLAGMGLESLGKSESAQRELRDKGLGP